MKGIPLPEGASACVEMDQSHATACLPLELSIAWKCLAVRDMKWDGPEHCPVTLTRWGSRQFVFPSEASALEIASWRRIDLDQCRVAEGHLHCVLNLDSLC